MDQWTKDEEARRLAMNSPDLDAKAEGYGSASGPTDDELCCATCGRPHALHGIGCETLSRKPTDPPPPHEPAHDRRERRSARHEDLYGNGVDR